VLPSGNNYPKFKIQTPNPQPRVHPETQSAKQILVPERGVLPSGNNFYANSSAAAGPVAFFRDITCQVDHTIDLTINDL